MRLHCICNPGSLVRGVHIAYVTSRPIPPHTLDPDFTGIVMNDRESAADIDALLHGATPANVKVWTDDLAEIRAQAPLCRAGHYQIPLASYANIEFRAMRTSDALVAADVAMLSLYLARPGEDKQWVRDSLKSALHLHPHIVPLIDYWYSADGADAAFGTEVTESDMAELIDIVQSASAYAFNRTRTVHEVMFFAATKQYQLTDAGSTHDEAAAVIKPYVQKFKEQWSAPPT